MIKQDRLWADVCSGFRWQKMGPSRCDPCRHGSRKILAFSSSSCGLLQGLDRTQNSSTPAFVWAFPVAQRNRVQERALCPRRTITRASYKTGKALEEARVHLDAVLDPGTVHLLSATERAHLRARRIRSGAHVTVFNSNGSAAAGLLQSDDEVLILALMPKPTTSRCISVAMGLIKSPSRADWAVEKLTELGITSISFVRTERTVTMTHPGEKRRTRWEKLSISAAKQSLRVDVPKIWYYPSFGQLVAYVRSADLALLLSPGGEPILSASCLSGIRKANEVLIIVGPEGGLTREEEGLLLRAGAQQIALGENRLRAETAVVAAAAVLSQI